MAIACEESALNKMQAKIDQLRRRLKLLKHSHPHLIEMAEKHGFYAGFIREDPFGTETAEQAYREWRKEND